MVLVIHQRRSQLVQLHRHHALYDAGYSLEIRETAPSSALTQTRQNGSDAGQIHFRRTICNNTQQCQYFCQILNCLCFSGVARSDDRTAAFHAECVRQGQMYSVGEGRYC